MQVVIGGEGRRPRRLEPITAAASRKKVRNGRIDIRSYDWQQRNWELFDRVGVVGYGMGLSFNTLSKAQIIPALLPENPNDDPEPIESGPEVDLIHAFRGPYGEAPELVASAGLDFQVAGEGWLWGNQDGEYDIVSSDQLRQMGQATAVVDSEGRTIHKIDDDDFICRLWRPHPRYRDMPHAPLTAVSDDCLEWLLLSRKARGQLRTRMSAGYLFIPTEISTVKMTEFTDEGEEAEDEWEEPYGANADADDLMAELIEVMTKPLLDEDDMAGVVPWLLRGPGEQGDNIKQEAWRRSDEEASDSERRKELTRGIATGLDWPVEKILGMGDTSYWNSWEIDKSAFEEHMDPLLMLALRSLTIGWFRPMLEEMGMSPEDARKRTMWRDLSAFTREPDWTTASEAHEALVISDKALRKYGRFQDEDKPDDEELERRKPVTIVAPSEESDAPSADDPGPAEPGSDEGDDVAASIAPLTAAAATRGNLDRLARRLAAIDQGLLTRITAAADRELNRALEKAGARMRSKIVNDEQMSMSVKHVSNDLLGRHLGPLYVREQLQLEEGDLIPPGTFRSLEGDIERWIKQGQDAAFSEIESFTGQIERDRGEEDRNALSAVEIIVSLLLSLAISRLFNASPVPDEGEIPETTVSPNKVMDALTVAGGAGMIAPQGERFDQGIGNGERTRTWMEQAGFFTEGFRWDYGDPSARDANFEPHRGLDGIEFASWEEPALANHGGWPGVGHYYPQDHGGCLCSYERIYFVETTE